MAPPVAIMPWVMPPPSKAGPAEQAAVTIHSEFPTHNLAVRADVDI